MTKREPLTVSEIAPVLYRVEEAAEALRLGRTIVYELIRCGRLRTVKVGTRRLVPVAAVREYAATLEDGAA
ncbi:helix-turn-helix domain-containing protein [Puerhibacterium puerhi]|uniref:helix-turn-helix domain-containing protein n=1 Tax=Puerhibacterium puerhi TaxID=2692623 RepID=UPI00135BEC9E|nr:helix-turn-helix domain-containing protein [Puerhibacterium puerhi]